MGVDELAIACKTDRRNISALWLSVYRLIGRWALSYCKTNTNRYELDDLIQSAYFALLKAVDDYSESCGYKFTTYLYYHCRNEFRSILGIKTSKREPAFISLDMPVADDESLTLADTLSDERSAAELDNVVESVYGEQLHSALNEALQTLPEINRQVIDMRFYKGLTFIDTAERLNLKNGEAVRRLEYQALRSMRRGKCYSMLKGFDYYSYGLKRTGFSAFKYGMESSVEAAVMKKLELEYNYGKIRS